MIDPSLRALLVCPVDHHALRDEPETLVCVACGRRYPIVDNIPVLLPDETCAEETTAKTAGEE